MKQNRTTMVEEINLLFTDNELKLIDNLIQILLYLVNLILDTDEALGFLEQAEADLLTQIEELLRNRLRGKPNNYAISSRKPHHPKESNTLLNGMSDSEINRKNRKCGYQMNF